MRKVKIIQGEYYHVLNRGNNKQVIFRDQRDWARFLFLILYFQSPLTFGKVTRHIDYFEKNNMFNVSKETIRNIVNNRYVDLVAFTLMSNHFHLILRESKEGGISQYMQRVLNAYSKYYNTKHGTSGHLFQGPFKFIHVEDDPQLIYLSAYIHKNIREVKKWINKEHFFPYSSFQDYVKENRWGELLQKDIIDKQFLNKEKYRFFVKKSSAKELS